MGSGNTGLSTALKLKNDGHKVCLYELPEFSESTDSMGNVFSLTLLSEKINLQIDLITNNAKEALDFSKIISVPQIQNAYLATAVWGFRERSQRIRLAELV